MNVRIETAIYLRALCSAEKIARSLVLTNDLIAHSRTLFSILSIPETFAESLTHVWLLQGNLPRDGKTLLR